MSDYTLETNNLIVKKFEDYLNDRYKEHNVSFRLLGLQIQIESNEHVLDETSNTKKFPCVTATIPVPEIELSEPYKEFLDKVCIQPSIKSINRKLEELKNESISS